MSFPSQSSKPDFTAIYEAVHAYRSEHKIFEQSINERSDDNQFRFYDGPPFVTGLPHYGHLASSVAKDVIPRYQTMKGKKVDRVRGRDCHGIPVEQKVQKTLGLESNLDIEKVGIETFINECYNYTRGTSSERKRYIDQFARWVDFDNSYKTMDNDYMESVRRVFKTLWDKGLIYKGKRVSLYSTKLETPISSFEVAMDDTYEEVNDPAITVAFDLSENGEGYENISLLVRTTTPWTIPVNIAAGVHKEILYSTVVFEGKGYIVAKNRIEAVFAGKEYEIIDTFLGEKLVGLSYKPPFDYLYGKTGNDKDHKIYHADFVSDQDGTGLVHEAPEFGEVDFQLAKKEGLTITEAMDSSGHYTSLLRGGDKTSALSDTSLIREENLEGVFYRDANPIVIQQLHELGRLFKKESITHRVAFCPRSGTPLVYKAQDSWFIDINGKQEIFGGKSLKQKCIEANEDINRYPGHNKHGRFLKSLESAPDRCISRTRYWGTPMPIYKAKRGTLNAKSDLSKEENVGVDYQSVHNEKSNTQTKIILVRHGKTDYNEKELFDCEGKAILLPQGIEQAECIADELEKIGVDYIYCSPLMRCMKTISPLAQRLGKDIIYDERIRECHIPSSQDKDARILNRSYSEEAIDGKDSESLVDVFTRVKGFLEEIVQQHPGKTIVVCSHGDPIVLMRKAIHKFDYDKEKNNYYIDNSEGKIPMEIEYLELSNSDNVGENDQSIHKNQSISKDDIMVIGSREELFQLSKNGSKNLVKHVYIRHGETDANVNKKRDGRGDAKLTEQGHLQAKDLHKKISSTTSKNDIIILSPLYRTFETATPLLQELYSNEFDQLEKSYIDIYNNFQSMLDEEVVKDYIHNVETKKMFQLIPNCNVYVDFRLPEVILEKSIRLSDAFDKSEKTKVTQKRGYESSYSENSEGPKHIFDRIESLVNEVNKKFVGKQVLYFGHGAVGALFIKYFEDYDFEKQRKEKRLKNGEIKTFYRNNTRNAELDLHRPFIDDVWFEKDGVRYERIPEVLDCWMESASMPYAQVHYPFENKEKFENSFPADYIVEYTGQIRAWFYVMHVLGVALFDAPAFKNVICHGVIAGDDGRKMSKSLGNFPDPKPTFQQYGGDAVRMSILTTPLFNGGDMSFSEDLIKEALKANVLPLWNAFYFFTTYANIDGRSSLGGKMSEGQKGSNTPLSLNSPFVKGDETMAKEGGNLLDQRILSELSSLSQTIDADLTNYDLTHSSRQIALFLENLTNWYIRRSRRRFWKSENDGDKHAAYQTLYTVLVEFCKIAAPFMPIVTEYMYRALTVRTEFGSVHLQAFPAVSSLSCRRENGGGGHTDLSEMFAQAQTIVRAGLAARSKRSIRVRQPLASLKLGIALDPYFADLISEELNIKQVIYDPTLNNKVMKICKPDGKAIGAKFAGATKEIFALAKSGQFVEHPDGSVAVGEWLLDAGSFEISYIKHNESDSVEVEEGIVMEIDRQITPALAREGYARDLVRAIQDARKQADYDIADRITLQIIGNTVFVEDIINHHGAYIQEETLSTISYTITQVDIQRDVELGEHNIEILLFRQ